MPGARVRASATLGPCPPGLGRAAERGSPPSVFSARCIRRMRSCRQAAPSAASGPDLPAPRKNARGRCVWPAPPSPGCGDHPFRGARLSPVAWGPPPLPFPRAPSGDRDPRATPPPPGARTGSEAGAGARVWGDA
ncbi:chitin-binding lectin 1-like [Neophocaena asiaeorientalis asiaeorientalis]|uniref:Chitin-binding lectin 1-like n=1 Tax=Neophocaena asiaeorientalis asiaeorientalis TaxID=1706337 RepID=A0A341CH51_NEOAA|nr:chitin-binding lectin 1-like [Neophocaena asiaeorientalis asiaeorientalis]